MEAGLLIASAQQKPPNHPIDIGNRLQLWHLQEKIIALAASSDHLLWLIISRVGPIDKVQTIGLKKVVFQVQALCGSEVRGWKTTMKHCDFPVKMLPLLAKVESFGEMSMF